LRRSKKVIENFVIDDFCTFFAIQDIAKRIDSGGKLSKKLWKIVFT
jgi:hypothetical protein